MTADCQNLTKSVLKVNNAFITLFISQNYLVNMNMYTEDLVLQNLVTDFTEFTKKVMMIIIWQ